jgi:hypothetical protein
MARPDSERPMTDSQRDGIKRLCHEASIPDKSGELYTEETAQTLIEDLREKASTSAEARHPCTGIRKCGRDAARRGAASRPEYQAYAAAAKFTAASARDVRDSSVFFSSCRV